MSVTTRTNERATEIFCEVLGVDPASVSDTTAYSSFDAWDSLKHMEMIARFEEEFDLEIEIDDVIQMETLGRIKQTLVRYLEGDA